MAERARLPLDKILVPDNRLRKVDERKAYLVGQSIAAGAQAQPVLVRPTPAAARPYTLVAGATRYQGCLLHGLAEIDVVVKKLDARAARRMEVEDNLIRDDLDRLERALHVAEYRRLWEEEHGEIRRGNPELANSANFAELGAENAQTHFFAQALDELGLSRRAVEYAVFIATKLAPALVERLTHTPAADNQSLLISLARMDADRQNAIAAAMANGRTLDEAIVDSDPNARSKAKITSSEKALGRIADSWSRLGAAQKWRALDQLGIADLLTPAQKAILASRFGGEHTDAA